MMMFAAFITIMYCSVVMALLATVTPPKYIERLDDLLKPEFEHVRNAEIS